MLKIMMLGIALAVIALSATMSIVYLEPSLSPPQHAQDDVLAGEADAPPIKATAGDSLHGPAPSLTISRLPNLGETAIVEITYTNTLGVDIIDPERNSVMTTVWGLSPEFEIVDAGGLQYETISSDDLIHPGYTVYFGFVPLRADESVSYRLEVRAVAEGPARITAVYLGGAELHLYIDDEETMLTRDHAKKYPELYTRPQPVERSDTTRYVTEAELKNAPTTVDQPTREETVELFTAYLKNSGDTVEWAVENLLQSGILNATELRTVLANVGFTEDEINEGVPSGITAESAGM